MAIRNEEGKLVLNKNSQKSSIIKTIKQKEKIIKNKLVRWIEKDFSYTMYDWKILDDRPDENWEVRVECISRAKAFPFEWEKKIKLTKLTFEK